MSALESFRLDVPRTALVVTDPQVDFLSPKGAISRRQGRPALINFRYLANALWSTDEALAHI